MPHLDSKGRPWAADFTLTMGVFRTGFSPTLENRNDWESQWIELGQASYDSGESRFAAVADASTVLPAGTTPKIYFWARNGRSITRGPEWWLATHPAWVWPSTSSFALPLSWTTTDAGTVIIGRIDAGTRGLQSGEARPVPESPDAWYGRYFTAHIVAPSWSEDSDHDGQNTLMEYALGSDPTRADPPAAPEISQQVGKNRTVAMARNPFSTAEPTLQYSDDLVHWVNAENAFALTENRPDRVVMTELQTSASGRRFMRFQFTVPGK